MTAVAMYAENRIDDIIVNGKSYIDIPVGITAWAGEAEMVPRCWAETKANVVWYRKREREGHFSMYEQLEEMVRDLKEFVTVCHGPSSSLPKKC